MDTEGATESVRINKVSITKHVLHVFMKQGLTVGLF